MLFAKFPTIKLIKYLIASILLGVVSYVGYIGYLEIQYIRSEIKQASEKIQEVEQSQLNFSLNLTEELYSDHLEVLQKQNLEFIKSNLESEIETLKTSDKTAEVSKVNDIIKSYNEFLGKFDRNTKLKLDTSKANGASTEWGNMLLAKEFEELSKQIADNSKVLDDDYNKYLASLPKEQTQPSNGGYSYVTVKIDRGTFYAHVIKLPFSKHKTKTVQLNLWQSMLKKMEHMQV